MVRIILSYSKINTYSKCPFKFRLSYIDKIPSSPKPYHKLGNILHSALRSYYEYRLSSIGNQSPSLDYMLEEYRESWGDIREGDEKHYQKGLDILTEYYYKNVDSEAVPYYIEQPFNIVVAGVNIIGSFDRVDKLEGYEQYEIIDYKSSKTMLTQEEIDEDIQLSIYYLAFQRMTGISPVKLNFYYLRQNQVLSTYRTDDEINELVEVIRETVWGISYRRFEPCEGEMCRYCDYKQYCPLKAEDPLPVEDTESRIKQLEFGYY